ncbi:unnamed protein product [Polarella glacialis]|uniref:CS domain-containing protein n=1 Tax=Polarella glacialis TaxID=89957 RepID=A0A813F883_POLGL|nr:unnamed protein product [Polarella glacialis]
MLWRPLMRGRLASAQALVTCRLHLHGELQRPTSAQSWAGQRSQPTGPNGPSSTLSMVLRSLAKTDAALAEVNAALELRPELPQALQLSALLWNDSAEAGKSALAAKQCFMLLSSTMPEEATSDKRRWQLRLLRDCEHLLAELGESLDSSLPRCYGASFDEDSSLTVCANEEMVVGLEVLGCGIDECNGVYESSRQASNKQEAFVNASGFRVSLEVLPTRRGQEAKFGWVIGRDRVGYFGAMTTDEGTCDLPPARHGWRSFAAGGGAAAPSQCRAHVATMASLACRGRALALRSEGDGDVAAEAKVLLSQALRDRSAAGELHSRAAVLTDMAMALRQLGNFQEALAIIAEALTLWPALAEAYLEKAMVLIKLSRLPDAAKALKQLLTMRPKDGRAACILLGSLRFQVDAEDWLLHHLEIPLVAHRLEHASKANVVDACDRPCRHDSKHGLAGTEAPFRLEDSTAEVHVHWVLPDGMEAQEVQVDIQAEHLFVAAAGVALFDQDLAHRIKTSESSWTFAAPDLIVSLSKSMIRGMWPKWEVLHKEDIRDRQLRLGGLPFDPKQVQYR